MHKISNVAQKLQLMSMIFKDSKKKIKIVKNSKLGIAKNNDH